MDVICKIDCGADSWFGSATISNCPAKLVIGRFNRAALGKEIRYTRQYLAAVELTNNAGPSNLLTGRIVIHLDVGGRLRRGGNAQRRYNRRNAASAIGEGESGQVQQRRDHVSPPRQNHTSEGGVEKDLLSDAPTKEFVAADEAIGE